MPTRSGEAAKVTPRESPPAGKTFPCVQCGARLEFDPAARALKCPYCGHVQQVEAGKGELVEHDLQAYLAKATGASTVAGRSCEVKCNNCGAIVLLEDKVAYDHCPYCGAFLENKPDAAKAMILPEGVLPFAVDAKQARGALARWLEGLWFAPNALRQFAQPDRLKGVYVPFWTFDSMTYTFYSGQRGDDYADTETYTDIETYVEDGETKTRAVTKTRTVVRTRWTPVSGEVRHFFDDVPVCASPSVPPRYSATLTPAELHALLDFQADYLSGFTTERYTLGPKEGFDTARQIMDGAIRVLCCQDIGGDHQQLDRVETQHAAVTYKHALLPIWLGSYAYRAKTYRVMVNGRTGNVLADRPYSFWKIVGLVLAIVALLLALLWLFGGAARGSAEARRSVVGSVEVENATSTPHVAALERADHLDEAMGELGVELATGVPADQRERLAGGQASVIRARAADGVEAVGQGQHARAQRYRLAG